MKRVFSANLSSAGLKSLADELRTYANVTLQRKCAEFTSALAEVGITVGFFSLGNSVYQNYISFYKETSGLINGASTLMIAKELSTIISMWDFYGQYKMAEISPLLMAEFGSGVYAAPEQILPDGTMVGRGTFPGQTHADEPYWHYKDLDGVWHTTSGVRPSRPLLNAYTEMDAQIVHIAQTVFGRD